MVRLLKRDRKDNYDPLSCPGTPSLPAFTNNTRTQLSAKSRFERAILKKFYFADLK